MSQILDDSTYRDIGTTASRRRTMVALIVAMRPRQWIKNSVMFAALVFSRNLAQPVLFWRAAAAFGLFCAISSAVYILNDILDIDNDRRHPIKRRRPIAAGEISIPAAASLGFVLASLALTGAFFLSQGFAALALIYLVSNLLYSAWLKRIVIVDVMIISSGFVIRAVAGGVVIGVEVSAWLILCAVLLSLFLGFTKRRQELSQLEETATEHRAILKEYSIGFLDQMISIVTSATVVAYFLYTLAPETQDKLGTPYLPLTIPFVLYGIFRYLYLVHRHNLGDNPTVTLYADRPLFINIVLWAVAAVVILYLT